MGWLSKAWKGVKKAVKKVASTAKKIAKKVAYAIPGGKQLWKATGKLGTKIVEGVGKVVNKLGPVGMIALSVLAPYAAPLWSAFGAAAGAAGGVLGSIGTAVYTAGNWVAGTLGSMSSGISKAIGTIAEGGFSGIASGSLSKASEQAVSGFAKAFTGEAGKAGIQAGVQAASNFAIKEAAGQSLFDQTVSKIMGDTSQLGSVQLEGSANQVNDSINKNLLELNPNAPAPVDPFQATQSAVTEANNFNVDSIAKNAAELSRNGTPLTQGATDFSVDSIARSTQMQLPSVQQQASNIIGNETASSIKAVQGTSLINKAGKVAKALISNTPQDIGAVQPLQPVGDVGGQHFAGNAFAQGGVGSGGGSFLSQAMLQAMQAQTQRMTRGFG